MRGDTEHVLPRNKLLDILQSHGFYADTFDYSTGEEIFSGDKTFAIGIHWRVGPAWVSIGCLENGPQCHFKVIQEMFSA